MAAGDWKKLHSAARWGKEDEFAALLAVNDVDAEDSGNGNRSVHIASQNGHLTLVNMLIAKAANLNAQNKGGQTAMHMAMEYDYYEVVLALEAAGADGSLKNEAGHAAATGIDGKKARACVALMSLEEEAGLAAALGWLEADALERGKVDKAEFVQIRMKRKKTCAGWTDAVDSKFKAVMQTL